MRVIVVSALILSTIVCAAPAQANFMTGNRLNEICSASESTPTHFQQDAECAGYLQGVLDSMIDFGLTEKNGICLRPSIQLGQIRDLVKNFLLSHPEIRDTRADAIVLGALAQGFSCQNQTILRERGN